MRLLTVRSWVRDPREAFFYKKKKIKKERKNKVYIGIYRSHGVGAAYEILVLGTPVRIWVGPFFNDNNEDMSYIWYEKVSKKRQRQDSNLRLQRRSDF